MYLYDSKDLQALNFNWVELMGLAHHPFQGP